MDSLASAFVLERGRPIANRPIAVKLRKNTTGYRAGACRMQERTASASPLSSDLTR
jgi:hypothetical protein